MARHAPPEVTRGKIEGEWRAESAAIGEPQDSARVAWRLTLRQQAARKTDDRGTVRHDTQSTAYKLTGQRGESEVTLQFDLLGARVKYHGARVGASPIISGLQMPHSTLTRESGGV